MLQRFAMVLSSAGLMMTVACSQSDSGITTAVKSKLTADVIVSGSEINVDTGKNVVTLNGTVDIPAATERALPELLEGGLRRGGLRHRPP